MSLQIKKKQKLEELFDWQSLAPKDLQIAFMKRVSGLLHDHAVFNKQADWTGQFYSYSPESPIINIRAKEKKNPPI